MKKVLFPILILLFSCSEKKSESKKTRTNIESSWTEFKTKDSIPELLYLTLEKALDNKFLIANPNQPFNATDVIDSLPRKQLRLLSRKNNKWRLTYIQGGVGKHYVYVECKIKKDSIYDFKIKPSFYALESNDSIDKYLKNKTLEPKGFKVSIK